MSPEMQPSVPDLLVALDRARVIASLWHDERGVLLSAISDLIHIMDEALTGAGVPSEIVAKIQASSPAIREVRAMALAFTAALAQHNLKVIPGGGENP